MEFAPHGCGRSSQSFIKIRLASPLGSSNCLVFIAQIKATNPIPPKIKDTGINIAKISIPAPYFNRIAFSETVIDDKDIASAAASGVAAPIKAKGTAITL
jgi:hypothetical protein